MATEKPKLTKGQPKKAKSPNLGGARPGAGRPALVPTDSNRKQVEAMSGYGVPIEQIAAVTMGGISVDSLYQYFREEMVAGKAKINAKIGQTLAQKALGGDTAAMIWWSKSQMRFREKVELEHTGADGGPIKSENTVVLDPSEAYKRLLGGKA
jgi:hypothetical protein